MEIILLLFEFDVHLPCSIQWLLLFFLIALVKVGSIVLAMYVFYAGISCVFDLFDFFFVVKQHTLAGLGELVKELVNCAPHGAQNLASTEEGR